MDTGDFRRDSGVGTYSGQDQGSYACELMALDTIHYPQDPIGIWGYEYSFHEYRSSCGFSESNNRYQYHEQVANVHSNNWDYCASSSVMHNQSIVGRRKRRHTKSGKNKEELEMVAGFEGDGGGFFEAEKIAPVKIAPLMAVPVREMVAVLRWLGIWGAATCTAMTLLLSPELLLRALIFEDMKCRMQIVRSQPKTPKTLNPSSSPGSGLKRLELKLSFNSFAEPNRGFAGNNRSVGNVPQPELDNIRGYDDGAVVANHPVLSRGAGVVREERPPWDSRIERFKHSVH
ncbi:hypothetical protein L1887_30161 [Cichorium endivia]|nr:hypothetical protein L1887_30161 [Cichorium endivia]